MISLGPVYYMDYKIANTTSLFFIAVCFGPLVPLLYPMGFIAIIIQYITEVITLRKFYKLNEARKQDEKMTIINLKLLLAAPVIGLCISIWALSNRQMFENKLDPIKAQGDVVLSHHLVTDRLFPNYEHVVLLKLGLLVSAASIAVIMFHEYIIVDVFKSKRFKNMPDYSEALKIDRIEDIVEDEKYFRDKCGFSILPQKSMDNFKRRIRFKETEELHIKVKDTLSIVKDDSDKESVGSGFGRERSSSLFGSTMGKTGSNYLIGQHSYQVFYDLDYSFQFNEKDPRNIKALK